MPFNTHYVSLPLRKMSLCHVRNANLSECSGRLFNITLTVSYKKKAFHGTWKYIKASWLLLSGQCGQTTDLCIVGPKNDYVVLLKRCTFMACLWMQFTFWTVWPQHKCIICILSEPQCLKSMSLVVWLFWLKRRDS